MLNSYDANGRNDEDYSLFVTNLPIELNEDGIEKIFKEYGRIKAIMARNEGQFAFISYETYTEAENAISSLDGKPPLHLRIQFRMKNVEAPKDEGDCHPGNFYPSNNITALKSEILPQIPMQTTDLPHKGIELVGTNANISRIDLLRTKICPYQCHNDSKSSEVSSQLMYSPYNEIEYAETNALWSRGCMTVDAAGRRHVTMGRGHTFYHIPEPHPKIVNDIGKVYEKRHARCYEYGFDQCKEYIGTCMHCSKHATLCCSFCDGFYCSRDCQIADWSKHQTSCKKIPPLVNANYRREFVQDKKTNTSGNLSLMLQESRKEINVPSINSVTLPEQEIFKKKQQQILRRPKVVKIDSNENIENILMFSQQTEFRASYANNENSATNSSSSIQEDSRVKGIHDDAFKFKRIDKINEDLSTKSFLSIQKFIKVQITVIKEPEKLFFVQKVDDFCKITHLMKEINEKIENFKTITAPVIGKIYGVIYDNVWHRGRVVSLNPLVIDYIDYGTIAEVPEEMNMKDIGRLAEIPRFSRLIKLPDKIVSTSKSLMPDYIISVKMIDVQSDVTNGDEIINVDVSEEEYSIDNHVDVTSNKNDDEIKLPLSIINSLTLGMIIDAEISDKIDETTAVVVLNFDSVKEMFERLLHPLAADCDEISSNYVNYVPNIHEFVCIKKPGDTYWLRGCVLKLITNENNSIDTIEAASLDEGVIINQIEKIVPLISSYNDICIFSAVMKKKNSESNILFGKPGDLVRLQITRIESLGSKNSINTVQATVILESGIATEVELYQWIPWRADSIVEMTGACEETHCTDVSNLQDTVHNSSVVHNAERDKMAVEKTLLSNKKRLIERFRLKNHTKVVLQSYRSPSVVFLRSLESDEIERNNRLIQNVAKSALTSSYLNSFPEIGDYVLAQYIDNNYYRAMVLTVEHEDGKIKIVYIDYGNIEVTTIKKLRVMSESLMDEPCCTRKVMLKGIKSTPPTKEAIDFLANLVANEEPLICEFDDLANTGDNFILKTISGNDINDEINNLLTPSWDHKNETNSYPLNSLQVEEEKPISNATIQYSESPTILTTKSFSLSDIEIGNFGNIGDTISALFLDTIEPGSKYVFALVDREMIVYITSVMPAIMKKYCESTEYYIPRDNELCIALYEDDNWYRGCCFKSRASVTTSLIYFLDFGNAALVLHENIRMMTTDFLKPGTFGCVCSVYNFHEPSATDISPKILSRLENLLLPNETYKVEIVDFDGEEYIIKLPEIHSKLVEEGLLSPWSTSRQA